MLALAVGYLLGGRVPLARPSLARLGLIFLACAATALAGGVYDRRPA